MFQKSIRGPKSNKEELMGARRLMGAQGYKGGLRVSMEPKEANKGPKKILWGLRRD